MFIFALDVFGIVLMSKFFGTIVAVLLQGLKLSGYAAKTGHCPKISLGIGRELLLSFRTDQKLRQLSSGKLQTYFRELTGVIFAQMLSEIVLEDAIFQGALHFDAPFLKAAAGSPI